VIKIIMARLWQEWLADKPINFCPWTWIIFGSSFSEQIHFTFHGGLKIIADELSMLKKRLNTGEVIVVNFKKLLFLFLSKGVFSVQTFF